MSSLALKIIAAALMVLDHVYRMLPDFPIWFSWLGRLSAPIFFFLSVEGFFHTKSKEKYMLRLFAFGVLMLVIDSLLNIDNNIFLSLGLGIALLTLIEKAKQTERKPIVYLLILTVIIASYFTEAGFLGVGMTLIFYYFRDDKKMLSLAYAAFSLILVIGYVTYPNFISVILYADYQWMMAFTFPFFLLYNGEKGGGGAFAKWFFYVFYPLHLILLRLIATVM